MSHGEAFLSLFRTRFSSGLFLLDEPEAALSPKRQLSFLVLLNNLAEANRSQFIIATHSPIILSFPEATLLSFDGGKIESVSYKNTEHYEITRDFLQCPERYLSHLFRKD